MKKNMDDFLNIDSQAIIYYSSHSQYVHDYFESEPTPYRDLEELVRHYQPTINQPHLVDFGCGTGRALCFFHYYYGWQITGVEFHPDVFKVCKKNIHSYAQRHPIQQTLDIYQRAAENFPIQHSYNIFYFFNPFSLDVFLQMADRLRDSFEDCPRSMDLILYYPRDEIVSLFQDYTPFERIQSIDLGWYEDPMERFDVFSTAGSL